MSEGKLVDFAKIPDWIDARDSAIAPTPLWLKNPESLFLYEYLADSRTLYVQFNAVANNPPADGNPGDSVKQFFDKVFAFVDSKPVDRLILDLRMNGGGSSELIFPRAPRLPFNEASTLL